MATAGEIFALIRTRGATTRTEIATSTGLSRTAVASRLAPLVTAGLVCDCEQGPSTGGRPATPVTFKADAGVVLSVAVGVSRTRMAVCDLAGAVLSLADIDQEMAPGPDDLMPQIAEGLAALLNKHPDARVYGVGLSLPGAVDRERGCSRDSPILRGWDGRELRPYFAAVPRLAGVPVVLDNDVNAIAIAERGPHADVLVVKASTGLGAGIIAGGVLQRGAAGAAGEFGHNKCAAALGRSCRCGDTGCLEAIAGGWAVVQALQSNGVAVSGLRDVTELANDGDPEARRMIRASGRHVGEGIAPAVNVLNPAVLVITGDMAGAYDVFVAGLRETLYGNAMATATRALQVVPSAHGGSSAIVGSAAMVLDEVLSARAVDALIAG